MNLGAFLVTFGLVIPAELPDKTFISCLVMASRHRPLPVWIGAATALVLQAGIAVVAGRLLVLLPATAVHSVVAALFIGGAAYLIFVPEREEEKAGARLAARDGRSEEAPAPARGPEQVQAEGSRESGPTAAAAPAAGSAVAPVAEPAVAPAADPGAGPPVEAQVGPPVDEHWWRPALATFSLLALAEFGDITQILIANLTARFRDAWAVFLGASLAFVIVCAVGVLAGRAIVRVVPLSLVRKVSGIALLGFGIYTIVELL